MGFKCHKCGKQFLTKGSCVDCKVPLEQTCPACGFGKDFCTCETPSTKAHKPR